MAHLGGVGGAITSALESLKGWKLLKLREALTCFLDVQSVNPMLKTSLLVFLGSKSSELMGVRSQRKITRA